MDKLQQNQLISIYEKESHFYLKGLSYSEFFSIALVLYQMQNPKNWLYHLDSEDHWRELEDLRLEQLNTLRSTKKERPPLHEVVFQPISGSKPEIEFITSNFGRSDNSASPKVIHAYRTIEFDESGTEVQVEGKSSLFQARHFERLKKTIQVEISDREGQNQFRDYTIDVSVGGVSTEENLPLWIRGTCRVKLTKPSGESVTLYASPVEPTKRQRRNRLKFIKFKKIEDEKSFHKWLIL